VSTLSKALGSLGPSLPDWARNSANSHGVCKPRFSLADYNDILHNQRAMDRDTTIHQIVSHQNFRPIDRRAWVKLTSETSGRNTMVSLNVNGLSVEANATPDTPLLWVLRDHLGLTGTKFGCGIAQCGACTVHLDGKPVRSCVLPVGLVEERAVTTIEAIGQTQAGQKVQGAWLDLEVVQCGYCQSGQVMAAAALLARNSHPDDAAIDAAMAGNICRCGTYPRIRDAIKAAAT
jgi:isoquinoline 1-oxidoreductase subunit alpha